MALKKSNLIDSVSTSDIQSAGLSRIYQHTQNFNVGAYQHFDNIEMAGKMKVK